MVIVFVFEPFSIGVKISEEPEKKQIWEHLCVGSGLALVFAKRRKGARHNNFLF